jgi:competence protein ComEC
VNERIARNWPALLVASVCIGIALTNWVRIPVVVLIALALGCVGLALRETNATRRLALAAAALLVAGVWWGGLRTGALEESVLAGHLGETATARVVVTGPARHSQFSMRMPARIVRFGTIAITERVLLQLPPGRAPPQGSVLELRARPVEPRGPETGFNERGWLARQGVHVVLQGRAARIVGRRGGIGGVADRLRAHVERTLASGTTGERRAVLVGIVLGEDEGLTTELRSSFRASGLMHLLAVSGQNVVITALGVVGAARVAGIGRLTGEGIAIVAILGYALAAGWQPSVVRATVAGLIASLAWLTARPRDRWHAMALGALVLLAWTPASLLDPGFQLSFAAVAAIFVAVAPVMRFWEGYPVPHTLAEVLTLAAVCGAVTAPIVWLHFGVIPVWTIPANVLAEPAMVPLICLSLSASVVAPFSASAAASLAWLAGWCAAWITFVARLVGGLPGAQIGSGPAVAGLAAALLGGVALVRMPRYRRRSASLAMATLVCLAGLGWFSLRDRPTWAPPTGLRISFLDVGQGDGILVEAPGAAVLVDQGPVEAQVARQLRRLGLRSLTAVLLTHPHPDHVGGTADVLRGLDVGTVLDPRLAMSSESEDAALRVARDQHIPVVQVRAGQHYRIGKLRLDVLWPDGPGLPSTDPNVVSTVVRVTFGVIDVLLTADAESIVTGPLRIPPVEVLKVAHHGSEDAGLPNLLRRLQPRVAVISSGAGNKYGHPRPETLAALMAYPGLKVYRTDLEGRIVLESDGKTFSMRTER